MEVKDAYEKLRISDVERKKVQEYLGSKNARIDLLLGLEPYTVASVENNGNGTYYQAEDILEDIELFSDIYGVMLKNESEIEGTLYRGTSEEECRFFSSITKRCLVASSTQEVGEELADGNKEPAVIRYKVPGEIPHIDVKDFIEGTSDGSVSSSVILPPFAKVLKFEFESDRNNRKYFDSVLKKGDSTLELKEGDLEKKEELKRYIIEHFDGFREFVNYAKTNPRAQFDSSYSMAYKFAEAVKKLIAITCKEKELEINQAKNAIRDEEKRQSDRLSARVEDDKRIGMISGMQRRISYIPEKVYDFCRGLDKLDSLIETENNYVFYASRLNIPFSRKMDSRALKKRINKIKAAVRKMGDGITENQVSDDATVEEASSIMAGIQEDLRAVESLNLDITGIDYLPHIFAEKMDIALKEQVDRKAFEVIKKLRIQKYKEDLRSIPEKPSFWTRITGRARIQSLQRENLKHKIELENLADYAPKRTYSASDTLSDIDAETTLLGVTNQSVENLRVAILSIFDLNIDSVKSMVQEKVSKTSNLPTKFNAARVSNRRQVKYLEDVNKFLEKTISLRRSDKQRQIRESNDEFGGLRIKETFLSDSEMFEKVDEMLKTIEEKTIDRLETKGIDTKGLGQDTIREVIQKKGGRSVEITDEPTIRLFDD